MSDESAWGIEPVPERLRTLSLFDGFLLWANLSVSLLVIVAGALLVLPGSSGGLGLSLPEAIGALVAAAVVGNLMLGVGGLVLAWLAGFAFYQWLYPVGPRWRTRFVAYLHPHPLPWGGASMPSLAVTFVVALCARALVQRRAILASA